VVWRDSGTINEFSEEGKGVEGIVLLIVVTCEVTLLIYTRSLISAGITTLSDTSLVEQVGTNCTRHPIYKGACMLLMVTSDSSNLRG
jgi:hypothetical protein